MRSLPLLLALALGLAACGQDAPPTPAASAALACTEVAELLERAPLRSSDVNRLVRAQEAADAAAEGDPRWAERADAVRQLRTAAEGVRDSTETPLSNSAQRTVNDAYRAAVVRVDAAC